jgi:hypothetical protein
MGDGSVISTNLFVLTFDVTEVEESGEYPINITICEATDADGANTAVLAKAGSIVVEVAPKLGDLNGDGEIDNRDIILLARYLVHLVEFDADQLVRADFNADGIVNNSDLVALARFLVE